MYKFTMPTLQMVPTFGASHYWQHTGDLLVQYDMRVERAAGSYTPVNVLVNGAPHTSLIQQHEIEKACVNNFLNLYNDGE